VVVGTVTVGEKIVEVCVTVAVVDVVCENNDTDRTVVEVSIVTLSIEVETCVLVIDVVEDVLSTLRTVSLYVVVVVVNDVLVV